MPSFLIRGLARYFAASAMESRARRQSSYTPSSDSSSDESKKLSRRYLTSWKMEMRWLLPFVQATGYQVIINNPKSHEQIVIDKDTKELPELTLEWMQKYDRQKLFDWMTIEKEKQQQKEIERQKNLAARRIEEARGRARFGNSFTLGDEGVQMKAKSDTNKRILFIPILCVCVLILALIGLWVYYSEVFDYERYEKYSQKYHSIMHEAENSPITELLTPEGFRFDMSESEFEEKQKNLEPCATSRSTLYDWVIGGVHFAGNKIYSKDFHEGKLCRYEITIQGLKNDSNYSIITENDVKNICNSYKAFLKKDYTFKRFNYSPAVKTSLNSGSAVKTYVLTKSNMALTLRYTVVSKELKITCENRPISAPIERKKQTDYKPKRYVPPRQYPYYNP